MPSPEAPAGLAPPERAALLALARESIARGLEGSGGAPPAASALPADAPEALRAPRASFVTLRRRGALRGCVGSLEARRPLAEDVACNAFAAAFRDPRFAPLLAEELAALHVGISVLAPAEPLQAEDEAALLGQLRPGVDGLVLRRGPHRATFLPAVWESLPEPRDFLRALRSKAGLPRDHWSRDLAFERYTVESFS